MKPHRHNLHKKDLPLFSGELTFKVTLFLKVDISILLKLSFKFSEERCFFMEGRYLIWAILSNQ